MKKLSFLMLAGGILLLLVWLWTSYAKNEEKKLSRANSEAEAVESFLLNRLENSQPWGPDLKGKPLCSSQIVWEKSIDVSEKVVYTFSECDSVVLKDGDLRSDAGSGEPPLYKLKKINGEWRVIDFDDRFVNPAKERSKKEWVNSYDAQIPAEIKSGRTINHFSTKGIVDTAANYYYVAVPHYPLNFCSANSSCQTSEVCVKHGLSNPGENTCVKTCTRNKDCGTAHTCRKQCVNGENGCPDSAKAICIPDLFSISTEKKPEEIIE